MDILYDNISFNIRINCLFIELIVILVHTEVMVNQLIDLILSILMIQMRLNLPNDIDHLIDLIVSYNYIVRNPTYYKKVTCTDNKFLLRSKIPP